MGVEVFAADEQGDQPVDTMRWVRLAEDVLTAQGVRGEVELSLLFVDQEAIAGLNRSFMGREGPTDVLAFPIDDEPAEGGRFPDSGGPRPGHVPPEPGDMPTMLGDVVICPAIAMRNAPLHAGGPHHDGSLDDEVALLVVHGILHLLGMDHTAEAEAEAMERRERELLERFHQRAQQGAGAQAAGAQAAGRDRAGQDGAGRDGAGHDGAGGG
jgi:probable rRNA maturation factor